MIPTDTVPPEDLPTEELFRDDATRTHCEAVVLRHDEHGVVLDRTVCYPQGGGQAGDRGRIEAPDGRIVAIEDTRKGERPGEIVHRLDADGAASPRLAPGTPVRVSIDVERRQAHRRFHTATHLLCALVPHPVDGCSITQTYARLDFHTDEPLDKAVIQAGLDRLVAEAHPVRQRWITEAELDAQPQLVRSMRVQPPRGQGRVRLVEVEGVDLQPCGGTHVDDTSQVGALRVTKIEKKSAMTRRVVLGFAP